MKYLGWTLDSSMFNLEQIKTAKDKATTSYSALSLLNTHIGSPTSSRRHLLVSVTQSVPLYDAEVKLILLARKRFISTLPKFRNGKFYGWHLPIALSLNRPVQGGKKR